MSRNSSMVSSKTGQNRQYRQRCKSVRTQLVAKCVLKKNIFVCVKLLKSGFLKVYKLYIKYISKYFSNISQLVVLTLRDNKLHTYYLHLFEFTWMTKMFSEQRQKKTASAS
jgi:hypothetical protein